MVRFYSFSLPSRFSILGAAVVGDKEDATPMQQIIVALLGLIPGLLIGLACLFYAPAEESAWISELGWTALTLNYFNLLPIAPLDGGRVVELLLGRFPWIRFVFGLLSAAALLLGGLFGLRLTAVIGVAVAAALVTQWRLNVVLRGLRNLGPPTDRRGRLQSIFQALTQPPFREQPATTRQELAKTLLRHLTTGPATWRTIMIGGSVYAMALAAPVYIGVKTSVSHLQEGLATMDTDCVPGEEDMESKPLPAILADDSHAPEFMAHEIAGHLRAKLPCDPTSHTYELASLSDEERLFWELYWFDMKLALGGFQSFFHHEGVKAQILAGLEHIDAKPAALLLKRSMVAFPNKTLPETPDAIHAELQLIDEDDDPPAHALWEQLEEEHANLHGKEIRERLVIYARNHQAEFSSPAATALARQRSNTAHDVAADKGERQEPLAVEPLVQPVATSDGVATQ